MVETKKRGFGARALDWVERVGNGLPDPATLFLILALATIAISFVCAQLGVQVTYKGYNAKTAQIEDITVKAVNLLSADSIRHLVTTVVGSFTGFFALGTVFTIILGVGVAEGTGFLGALLKRVAIATPRHLLTAVVVFLGVMSNIASSTGYVVLVPLGAILFMAFKRHPIAGLAAAFAGVSGGWSANLLIGTNDPMFAGMSTQAARLLDPNYTVLPIANWYFMMASTVLVMLIGTFVTDKIIEPRLGVYDFSTVETADSVTADEKRGMRFAGIAVLLYVALMVVLVAPPGALLRNPKTDGVLQSPFMSGIIFFMMLLFLISGLFYGIGARVVKNDKDVVKLMNKSIAGLSSFMVLIFFAAQFNTLLTCSA